MRDIWLEQEGRKSEIWIRERDRALRRFGINCRQCGGGQMVPDPRGPGQIPCPKCKKLREKAFRKKINGRGLRRRRK